MSIGASLTRVHWRLWLAAIPALLAGFLVLAVADVGPSLFLRQGIFSGAAMLLALALACWTPTNRTRFYLLVQAAAVVVCAAPLLVTDAYPARWLTLGGLGVYCAGVVAPSALLAINRLDQRSNQTRRRDEVLAWCFVGLLAAVFALQPDASQALAFAAATLAGAIARRGSWHVRALFALLILALLGVAFARPDPLQPVAHVEAVFEVALGSSLLIGAGVIVAALAWLGLLWRALAAEPSLAIALVVYYASLFGCSIAGLTPAPLIGYGAGPVLGYGLFVALASDRGATPRQGAVAR